MPPRKAEAGFLIFILVFIFSVPLLFHLFIRANNVPASGSLGSRNDATPTNTFVLGTATWTPTYTPTNLPIWTPTFTPTATRTFTPTFTPTRTSTPTATMTFTRTFTPSLTATPETPTQPPGASPVRNFSTTRQVVLAWNRVPWAAAYEVQLAAGPNFALPIYLVNSYVPATTLSFTTHPLPDGTYYWRVRALRGDGTAGSWSQTESFVVSAP